MIYTSHGILVRICFLFVAMVYYAGALIYKKQKTYNIFLCYHGIKENQYSAFQWQMKYLAYNKDRYHVFITFDDAFENLIKNAMPVLKELSIPAVIFAVPGNLGQTPQWNISSKHPEYHEKTMSAQQLKMIHSDLITIGSHTQTHPDLSKLLPDQVRYELLESKLDLERLLGQSIEDLALPHGAYSQDVLDIAREVGYKRVYTLEPRMNKQGQEGKIGRFSMSPNVWPIEFYLTCCGAYSWLFYFRKLVRRVRMILKGNK